MMSDVGDWKLDLGIVLAVRKRFVNLLLFLEYFRPSTD